MIEGLFLTKTPQKLDFFCPTFEVQFKREIAFFVIFGYSSNRINIMAFNKYMSETVFILFE